MQERHMETHTHREDISLCPLTCSCAVTPCKDGCIHMQDQSMKTHTSGGQKFMPTGMHTPDHTMSRLAHTACKTVTWRLTHREDKSLCPVACTKAVSPLRRRMHHALTHIDSLLRTASPAICSPICSSMCHRALPQLLSDVSPTSLRLLSAVQAISHVKKIGFRSNG